MDVETPIAGRTATASPMRQALVLARLGMGHVRPNPPVGAVVVADGVTVGSGFHRAAGERHAEILALAEAGDRARGGDLYVTLEPCNHQGRTPPCVPAILEAGIRRVFVAGRDPNPLSGAGIETLTAAGVEVVEGPGRREAAYLMAGFISLIERQRPRFSLKMAVSMDGRIASTKGDSRWISSEIARAWVHRRRREADAVLVGAGTVLQDNPALTTRHVKGRSADRIVLDSSLRTRPQSRVYAADGPRRIVATTAAAPEDRKTALEAVGVEVRVLEADPDGRVSLAALALDLGREGYTNVLVEGGGTVAGRFLAEQLVDTAWVVMARHLLLGGGGPGWTQGLDVSAVPRAVQLSRSDLRPLGPDWLTTLVPESAGWWDPETQHV